MWSVGWLVGSLRTGHPDIRSALVLWSLLAPGALQTHSCNGEMRSWFNIIKKRQTRSHCASGTLVCANCCCMPIGNRISDRAPCCLFKKHGHYKEHLCAGVRDWHRWTLPFPSARMRRSVSTGTPVDQNGIITTLFPQEMMRFLTRANTRLRLERQTGNWVDKHLQGPATRCSFYTSQRPRKSPCHQTFLYLARDWDLAGHNCKNTLFIYTSSKKHYWKHI